jgi:hypothetical protein
MSIASVDSIVAYGFELNISGVDLHQAVEHWEQQQPEAFARRVPSLVELCVEAALLNPEVAGLSEPDWKAQPGLSPFVHVLATGAFDAMPNYAALVEARGPMPGAKEGKGVEASLSTISNDATKRTSHRARVSHENWELLFVAKNDQVHLALAAVARSILGDALLRRIEPATPADADGSRLSKKAKTDEGGGPTGPIVLHPLSSCGNSDDGKDHSALLLVLRHTIKDAIEDAESWKKIRTITLEMPTVTPLETWALGKLAYYVAVPTTRKGPAWLLATEHSIC